MEPITASILAKPALQLATKLLKPLASRLEAELNDQARVAMHRLFGSYTQYLANSFERHSYFTSVVFKNEQRRLIEFYQPLTLVNTRTNLQLRITDYPAPEINEVKSVLIVDTAGMGKTTLLKTLFLNCVTQEAGIPIFIELRKLSKKKSLLDFILEELSDVQGKCKEELFFKLLSYGEFVFFLDGYDEIPESERAEVTASIQQFIQKSSTNKFIMSSRDELGLVAFSQFQRYTIRPLEQNEAFSLIRKYATPSLAEALIQKLLLPQNSGIHEFLTNPLLTSLLYKSFEFKHTIPLKRHIFYRQVFESLFESHDLTKDGGEFQRSKRSGLDIDRLDRVLRALGAITYKAGKTEYTKSALLDYINDAKKLASENRPSASNILHDITHAVPLLVEDGNYIRWSHRSIQEYFAAQYICKSTNGKQKSILLDYFHEKNFSQHLNLVLLCADIDRPSFDHSIGKHVAETLLHEYENSYVGLDPAIPTSALDERRELTVGRITFLVNAPRFNKIPSEAEQKIHSEKMHQIHRQMMKHCPSATQSSVNPGEPGVGRLGTAIDTLLNSASNRLDIPFVSYQPFLGETQRCSIMHPEEDIYKIDDTPNNRGNKADVFLLLNSILKNNAFWRFNPGAAKLFLSEIAEQAEEKSKVEPW